MWLRLSMRYAHLVLFLLPSLALPQTPPRTLPEASTRASEHVQVIAGFPNIAIVTGDRATLVVDTGLGPSNGAIAARIARKLGKASKLYLTTTHFHPEHAAGEDGFPP